MNVTQLDQDTDFLCGSTSGTYSRTNKRRNQNIEYQRIATLIWASDGGWHFDDTNNTDSPIAYKTLANASAAYIVPTTALRIEGVEVKDNGAVWHKLNPITYSEMNTAPQNFFAGGGMPLYYQLEGNEINLYPSPATNYVTMASGMLVRLSRLGTDLGVSATTTTPGFAIPYHRMLSYAAAIDFTQDDTQRKFLLIQRDRLEKGLINFYAKRADEFPAVIRPRSQTRWRSLL